MIKIKCSTCKEKIEVYNKISRSETCPKCNADLHCCFNCEFYDLAVYNECHEISAERVVDKETSNFCDYFKVAVKGNHRDKALGEADKAKKKLEEMFAKKK